MKKLIPAMVIGAALAGFVVGYAAKPSPQPIIHHFIK